MSGLADQNPSDSGDGKPPKSDWEATRKEPWFDLKFSHFIEIILTGALVGIAYFQYTVYTRQAGIMQTQTEISRAQNDLTIEINRALLVEENIGFVKGEPDPADATDGLDFIVKIKNVGRHVASITGEVKITSRFGITHKELPPTPEFYDAKTVYTAPIAPDGSVPIKVHAPGIKMISSAPEPDYPTLARGIENGTFPFWVYGRLEYDTGYKTTGELGFCRKFVPIFDRAKIPLTFITCNNQSYSYIR